MHKIHTIINEGRLLGYIKLPEEAFDQLGPDEALLLVKQQNAGDTTITTFQLLVQKVRMQ